MSKLRALQGLLNYSKSLVFTQTKDLTLKGTQEFQTSLAGKTGEEPKHWDKARKKDLTVKSPEEDKDQDLASETDGDKCRQSSDHLKPSKSSISVSERSQWKLKFEEKGRVEPRIEDIGIFLSVTTLNSLGY